MNPIELESLERLASEDLILTATQDGSEFVFKHAMIQEAAYELLLKQDRRCLHRVVEQLYANDLDEYAALLVRYYAEAGDDHKTCEYATRAGDRASRLHAFPEARAHYAQALELLPSELATLDEKRQRVDALVRRVSRSLLMT